MTSPAHQVSGSLVQISGPLFTGESLRVVDQFLNAAVAEIGREVEGDVQINLKGSLRNPTGHYQSQINMRRPTKSSALVNDAGVIYGPWLEGIGSRNKTTRFKGYFSFRRAAQKIGKDAVQITEKVLRRYIGRM